MKRLTYILICLAFGLLAACSDNNKNKDHVEKDSKTIDLSKAHIDTLLTRFDSLDFDVYSNQKWEDLHISHADNIIVHYPDGHTSTGIKAHIDELKPMFVFAPDTKIKKHPVRFGVDNWTSVIGEMEGTFTKPMPIGGGKTISPTGKKFKLSMVTLGHWENGKMIEEYLFWDNLSFMKQIGVAN